MNTENARLICPHEPNREVLPILPIDRVSGIDDNATHFHDKGIMVVACNGPLIYTVD